MNKIFTFIMLCMLGITASAQTERKAIKAVDSNEDTHYYYYNEKNQLTWELVGPVRKEYSYNADGQCTAMKQYAWVEATKSLDETQSETYTYDASGNMTHKEVVSNRGTDTYDYSDYENGIAKTSVYCDRGLYYYDWKTAIEYNTDGTVAAIRTQEFDRDYPEDGYYKLEDYEYTYTDGQKTTETYIAYKYDGTVRKTSTTEFTYTDLSAAYAPQNLKAEAADGNVTLTWSPVAGAEKYIVTYDVTRVEVNATTYSATIETGNRLFTVQAVISGVERNAATPVATSIEDKGKLPITDLAVGTIFETEEETESTELTTRTFFNIPLTWSLPAGHSRIEKFKIHYSSTTYGETYMTETDPTATNFTLKIDPFEVTEWDEDKVPYKGVDTPIFVTIVYETGESEKSNIVVVNPFKTLGHETAISSITCAPASHSAYSITGQPVDPSSVKGIIIKNGKKYLIK